MKARIKRKIQKRPFLYNVGQVFKACDWITSIQRGNMVWRRYRYHLVLLLNQNFKYESKNKINRGFGGCNSENKYQCVT